MPGGPTIFNIVSKCNTFLTYPGAQSGAIALRLPRAPLLPIGPSRSSIQQCPPDHGSKQTLTLGLSRDIMSVYSIIDAVTNTALTAWDHHPGSALPDAPVNF
jgi:hypothetical protein